MDVQQSQPLTMCFLKVALTATGAATTIGSTGTIPFMIKGKAYSKAALSSTATPTTDWSTGNAFLPVIASTGSVFAVGLDSGGTVRVIQGTVVPTDGVASSTKFLPNAPQFGGTGPAGSGSTDNDFCPIAYILVKGDTTVSGNWVFGTGNWNATGITLTIVDCCMLPDRPQAS